MRDREQPDLAVTTAGCEPRSARIKREGDDAVAELIPCAIGRRAVEQRQLATRDAKQLELAGTVAGCEHVAFRPERESARIFRALFDVARDQPSISDSELPHEAVVTGSHERRPVGCESNGVDAASARLRPRGREE